MEFYDKIRTNSGCPDTLNQHKNRISSLYTDYKGESHDAEALVKVICSRRN